MPTLQELMDDMDLVGNEKTAGELPAGDVELEQLATQVGLGEGGGEKLATGSLDGLYNDFFPDDQTFGTSEKTAGMDKVAEYQEALGARAYDYFQTFFDQAVEKIAADTLTGSATIAAPKAHMAKHDNPHTDTRPQQALPSNYAGNGGRPMDTSPSYTNELPKGDDNRTVGHMEARAVDSQKTAAILDLATRKHMLLSMIQG